MKILDVDLFQEGLKRNIIMLDRLSSEMEAINDAVKGLVQMEDQLKGAGGNAIRSFYQECHLPFIYFFQSFSEQFKQVLSQMEAALHSLEPDSSGYILETFLEGELEQGLILIGDLTASLTDEANSIMDRVSDILGLPHLDDSGVQEGVISSKRKRNDTLMQLYEFDANQTTALAPIVQDLMAMETWVSDIEGLFTDGVTDVDFRSNQWAAISMNSGLKTAIEQQTSPVNGGVETSNQENLIGTEITPGTFRALEGKKTKTINRDAYGNFSLLIFHLYENGLIVKEYQLGTSKPIQYEVVNKVEEEFNDGGFRELEGYFEGTPLAIVDYLRPHTIVKKGFKLAFLSVAKPSKYKGDFSVKKTPTVENKSKGSVNGSKEAGNPNKGTGELNKDLAKAYLRDIEAKTGRKVNKEQIHLIKEDLRNKNYEKLTPKETAKHRSKFTSSLKDKLIAEWEEKTNQKWPRYTEEVLDKNGEVARSIGQPYDAHHIIENNFGGPHEWWNIHPAKYPNEHQAGIHGKGAPSGKLFPRR